MVTNVEAACASKPRNSSEGNSAAGTAIDSHTVATVQRNSSENSSRYCQWRPN